MMVIIANMANTNKILGLVDKNQFHGSAFAEFMYFVARFFCLLYVYITHELEFKYSDAYDPNENYVCAANHKSLFDPPVIGSLLNSPTAFIAKKELFKNGLFADIISLCSAIYIDREKPGSSSIKSAKKILKNKAWKLLIFIEGTRSLTDKLGEAQTGAAFLARLCSKPLLPVGISYRGSNTALSGKKIVVNIGEPYHFSRKEDLNEVSNECLRRIAELCDYQL